MPENPYSSPTEAGDETQTACRLMPIWLKSPQLAMVSFVAAYAIGRLPVWVSLNGPIGASLSRVTAVLYAPLYALGILDHGPYGGIPHLAAGYLMHALIWAAVLSTWRRRGANQGT